MLRHNRIVLHFICDIIFSVYWKLLTPRQTHCVCKHANNTARFDYETNGCLSPPTGLFLNFYTLCDVLYVP